MSWLIFFKFQWRRNRHDKIFQHLLSLETFCFVFFTLNLFLWCEEILLLSSKIPVVSYIVKTVKAMTDQWTLMGKSGAHPHFLQPWEKSKYADVLVSRATRLWHQLLWLTQRMWQQITRVETSLCSPSALLKPAHMMNWQRVTTSVPVSGGEVGLSRARRRWLPILWHFVPKHHAGIKWGGFFLWNWVGKWWTCSAGCLRADRSPEVREAGCDSKVGSSKCGWETVAEEKSTLSGCWGEFHRISYGGWLFWQSSSLDTEPSSRYWSCFKYYGFN